MKQPTETENLGELLREAAPMPDTADQLRLYAFQPLPDEFQKVMERQQQMSRIQDLIRKKQAAPRSLTERLLGCAVLAVRGVVPHSDYSKSVDDLAMEYIKQAEMLNEEVGPIITHASGELAHITRYSDFVLSEFERAKNRAYMAHSTLAEANANAEKLAKKLSVISMLDGSFTDTKQAYDDANREAADAFNEREAFALRINYRLLERKDGLAKEGIVRNTVAELDKVRVRTGMFVQSVRELFGTETLLQALYATTDAIRSSSSILQELANARSTLSYDGTRDFVQRQKKAEYTFPPGILHSTTEQGKEAGTLSQGSIFEDVHQQLSQPYIKRTAGIQPEGESNVIPIYTLENQKGYRREHRNGHKQQKPNKARSHWKR